MFTLTATAKAFAEIDNISPDEIPALDKSIRNISQRVYTPPADRQGRADLYSLESVCALRLLQAAMASGIDRVKADAFARYLHYAASSNRRVAVDGGYRTLSPIEEAIARVRAGQVFDFNLDFYKGGRAVWSADWPHDDPEAEKFADDFFASISTEPPIATFTIHASLLIGELLPALDQAKV